MREKTFGRKQWKAKTAAAGLLAGVLAFGGIGFSYAADGTQTAGADSAVKPQWQQVPYANLSDAEKFDLYLPSEGNGPFPVIVAINGEAAQSDFLTEALKHGYAVATVNYRTNDQALAPIQDVKAAIRFLRAYANYYKLDANKVAAWGGSLAALVGTSGEVSDLEELYLGYEDESSRVQAVVDLDGAQTKNDDTSSQADKLNPEKYVSADDPVFFVRQASGLTEKLIETTRNDHVTVASADEASDTVSQALDFLDKQFK